ncbi:hypothetical protein EV664_10412 [Stakelama pacifica]|uniref:Uncharacterized protein n=1 Tax=Stakelama pacifica TaxID=517720 RepID=A0A4R6FPF3_9SPHN|nr:hypothetical protein EV664_10412 [Stakelama pacifica]
MSGRGEAGPGHQAISERPFGHWPGSADTRGGARIGAIPEARHRDRGPGYERVQIGVTPVVPASRRRTPPPAIGWDPANQPSNQETRRGGRVVGLGLPPAHPLPTPNGGDGRTDRTDRPASFRPLAMLGREKPRPDRPGGANLEPWREDQIAGRNRRWAAITAQRPAPISPAMMPVLPANHPSACATEYLASAAGIAKSAASAALA